MQTNYELNLKKRLIEDEAEYENRLNKLEYLNKYIEDELDRHKLIENNLAELSNNEELNTINRFLKLTKLFGTKEIDISSLGDAHLKSLVEKFKSLPKYKEILSLDEQLKECQELIRETRKNITTVKKELCTADHLLLQHNNGFICKKCDIFFQRDDYHYLSGRVLVYNTSDKKPRHLVLSSIYHEFYNQKEADKYSEDFMNIVTSGIKEDQDVYAIRKVLRKKYFRRNRI